MYLDLRMLFVACLCVACNAPKSGSGEYATQTLDLPSFDELQVIRRVDVDLTEGDTVAGEVTCDDNLIDYLIFEVQGGKLTIDTQTGIVIEPTRCVADITAVGLVAVATGGDVSRMHAADFALLADISGGRGELVVDSTAADEVHARVGDDGDVRIVHARAPTYAGVLNDGSGHITFEGMATKVADVRVSGSGDAVVTGKADLLFIDMSGSGPLAATDLEAIDVEVTHSGSGTAEIRATGTVSGRLSGSGNLVVEGPATIDVETTGSGTVTTR